MCGAGRRSQSRFKERKPNGKTRNKEKQTRPFPNSLYLYFKAIPFADLVVASATSSKLSGKLTLLVRFCSGLELKTKRNWERLVFTFRPHLITSVAWVFCFRPFLASE